MSEQGTPKAVREKLHGTRIASGPCPDGWAYQALCDTPGCGWESYIYGEGHNPTTREYLREYLAESAASEHQRAAANWPGTV
jgi:hypothetical protein